MRELATATMSVAAVAVTMETGHAAKAAIGRTAVRPAIRTGHRDIAGAAVIPARRQTHRYGADRRTSHQCQHDAARAFHGGYPFS